MLMFLLWVALFLDVLDSFILPNTISKSVSSSSSTTRLFLGSNNVTLTIPKFSPSVEEYKDQDKDQEGYSSVLHKIHVRTLLSKEEAKKCLEMATTFAESTGSWNDPDWERHASYATCDFAVEDCEILESYLKDIGFDDRLWQHLSYLYDVDVNDLSYLDLFVAHYQAKSNDEEHDSSIMDRLEAHRDGTLLSFSLLLNDPNDFTGGGTFYDALRDVDQQQVSENSDERILHPGGIIRPKAEGQAVLHCGKILHGADVVTSGKRTVLVGFVDVDNRCIREGALAEACTNFGRMDVAKKRYKRQLSKGNKGWTLSNSRWLQGKAHVTGLVPAFSSAIRRAESEYQRLQKLKSEDRLLRRILLPRDERRESFFEIFDGDITVL